MIFQYVIGILLACFLFYVLLLPRQILLRKIFVLLFAFVMMLFAIKPEWSTFIANQIGIGRGADLLFYISHLVLFFIGFVYYVKFKVVEVNFAKLVRKVAILEAEK
jgi:small membrane protein